MSITSLTFLIFITIGVIIYYVVPKKLQWMELLLLSIFFYCCAAQPISILYLVVVTAIAYFVTMAMQRIRKKDQKSSIPFVLTILSIIIIITIWFVVKGKGLWFPIIEKTLGLVQPSWIDIVGNYQIVAALGMGYYTLQIIGYIIDCYWENISPQGNPFKLFLFTAYFPQLTTGPISRYVDLETLFYPHGFVYENICFGAQRILWGLVKKLVVAERIGVIVSGILGNSLEYYGFYSWIVVLLYPLQMYADFSGCMDIVLGVSQLFGIRLAENFNNPFFARSSQEFWQRWHITLGSWAKDYVLYPLLKSGPMVRFGKYTKKKFGRVRGAFLKNCVGMFCLWMVMGIWHGGYKYIIGVSLWYWCILMLGNLLTPTFNKITSYFDMNVNSFSWHLFQSLRTYVIYAIGATFFIRGVSGGLILLRDCLKVCLVKEYANPWIFFDESFLNLGVTYLDLNLIVLGVAMMIVVGILREKYGYARKWIQRQTFVFRWLIWLFLLTIVLIYGIYGPGYSAAQFIYQGF